MHGELSLWGYRGREWFLRSGRAKRFSDVFLSSISLPGGKTGFDVRYSLLYGPGSTRAGACVEVCQGAVDMAVAAFARIKQVVYEKAGVSLYALCCRGGSCHGVFDRS